MLFVKNFIKINKSLLRIIGVLDHRILLLNSGRKCQLPQPNRFGPSTTHPREGPNQSTADSVGFRAVPTCRVHRRSVSTVDPWLTPDTRRPDPCRGGTPNPEECRTVDLVFPSFTFDCRRIGTRIFARVVVHGVRYPVSSVSRVDLRSPTLSLGWRVPLERLTL